MNIFDYAIKMEEDGIRYYSDLANWAPNKGLKNICLMLVKDEEKHKNTFKAVKEKAQYDFLDTVILTDVKTVFEKMGKHDLQGDGLPVQKELYQKALQIEAQSRNFYKQKAEEVLDREKRAVLLKIADEEAKHYRIIENVIELISRPEYWLENAEFNHLEVY